MFKKISVILAFLLTVLNFNNLSSEPFVVLSYNNSTELGDRDNEFAKDPDYFTKHRISPGESLNLIINNYYGNSGLNKYFLQLAIVSLNSHAFRNRNVNYMVADESIHLPSINQITKLMKGIEFKLDEEASSGTKNIYFFGG